MVLYAADLDGTLLRSDKSVSDESADTLNWLMEKGVFITYATARAYVSASPLVSKIRFKYPAVTMNGVFVINPENGEHIIENVFSERSRELAFEFFELNSLAPLVYSYIDGKERVSYIEKRAEDVRGYIEAKRGDKRLRPVKSYGDLSEGRVFYFTLLNPKMEYGALDSFFCAENGFDRGITRDTYHTDEIWYEIFNAGASKANALKQAAALMGADGLICFGDNDNDISMLKAADIGIAMGNATENARRAAKLTIGSNDEDAVARYIYEREHGGNG